MGGAFSAAKRAGKAASSAADAVKEAAVPAAHEIEKAAHEAVPAIAEVGAAAHHATSTIDKVGDVATKVAPAVATATSILSKMDYLVFPSAALGAVLTLTNIYKSANRATEAQEMTRAQDLSIFTQASKVVLNVCRGKLRTGEFDVVYILTADKEFADNIEGLLSKDKNRNLVNSVRCKQLYDTCEIKPGNGRYLIYFHAWNPIKIPSFTIKLHGMARQQYCVLEGMTAYTRMENLVTIDRLVIDVEEATSLEMFWQSEQPHLQSICLNVRTLVAPCFRKEVHDEAVKHKFNLGIEKRILEAAVATMMEDPSVTAAKAELLPFIKKNFSCNEYHDKFNLEV